MNVKYLILAVLILSGCAPKMGEYSRYSSDEYIFVENTFINRSFDCLELGKMKDGGFDVKYCVGENYAKDLVAGFVFKHEYKSIDERMIGAKIAFKTKQLLVFECGSETIEGVSSGKEYINCMIPHRNFDMSNFIVFSKEDIVGELKAAVGEKDLYRGVINSKGKELIKEFMIKRSSFRDWKEREL